LFRVAHFFFCCRVVLRRDIDLTGPWLAQLARARQNKLIRWPAD